MGQALSDQSQPAPPSHEEVTKALANKFAEKCFTSLELYSLRDVFKSLADHEQNVRYLKEDTVARFLEIPDILGASAILFQMMSYIGAFPFLQDAPAVLGLEQTVMVITIMTERYRRVLAKGATDRRKLLFKSMAVYDRKLSAPSSDEEAADKKIADNADVKSDKSVADRKGGPSGFAIDEAGDEEDDDGEEENDELVLAAFDSLDYLDAFKYETTTPKTHGAAMVPADNFRKLIMLLLLIAPLDPQESLSLYSGRVSGAELESLRTTAECVLAAFLNVEQSPGIKFHQFNTIIPASMPFIFNGFTSLFEHFLFSKNIDFHKRIDGEPPREKPSLTAVQPLLQDSGSIMNLNVLSQLSFFIPGSSLFRRVRLLYSGDDDGFSMGSFETKVFHWRAPTILLVSGNRLSDDADYRSAGAESAFLATLPPKRFPSGTGDEAERITFGVYVSQPWKHTHRECFGGDDTLLFQLSPVHDVFRASSMNKDYVTFTKPSSSTNHAGISFGCPPPPPTHAYRRSSIISLGSVSLVLDSSFEFGCFTHDYTSRGGAFQTSAGRKSNFQDRFEVTNLEVWGCGGDEEAKHQAEHWAWEAREAEARRKINLGTGDIEADRALLEMAGLIGQNRSGGSMG
ncbi:TLD-domain-containing protein [Podospora appendiculata]|uniref:Restriction of telomere capping protein 5 n=1 Tax=Podospora appendiculata TaxID=314037 RepID=A0AAE1CDV6_9PEZI|nr:TLD-domain-containing protein [Podospora appendiculata]